jgi:hypothetical protein
MKVLRLLALLATACCCMFAQADRGTITGTISDATGALIPGAKVNLTNVDTGAHYDTVTTGTGNYTIPSVPVGTYNLAVEQPGFSRYEQKNIKVLVAVTTRVDVSLQVGQANQSVEVNADASQLQTESAESSTTITGKTINDLPLNFGIGAGAIRNPLSFIGLAPGSSISGWNVIKVNGSPTSTFRVLLEGQESSSVLNPKDSDENQPSVEAIQEFTVQGSNFAPEFGQAGGGLFNFTTKSGTNTFHGTAYDYITNEALNAGVPFSSNGSGGHVRPQERLQDYGFNVGGPVVIPKVYDGHNKTFFFFNFEGYRDVSTLYEGQGSMPTDLMRQGNFSQILGPQIGTDDLKNPLYVNEIFDPNTTYTDALGNVTRTPFPGNILPSSRIDPAAAKVLSYIPNAQNGNITNNYTLQDLFHKLTYIPSFKIDHNITDNAKISGYYSQENVTKDVGQDGLPDPISTRRYLHIWNHTYRLNYDQTLSPTLLLHLGAGYERYTNPDTAPPNITGFDNTKLGITGLPGTGFPHISGLGTAGYGGLYDPASVAGTSYIGIYGRGLYVDNKPTGVADVTWIRGNHSYKFGAEMKQDTFANRSESGLNGAFTFSGNETALPYLGTTSIGGSSIGFPLASFLLGQYDSASIGDTSAPDYKRFSWGLYAQDTWKVSRKLTLTYGLRYDLQEPNRELWHRTSSFSPTTPNPNAGGLPGAVIYEGWGSGRCDCNLVKTYKLALAPRLGAAYQLDSKTVIRAGWGLSYAPIAPFSYIGGGNSQGMGFNSIPFPSPSFGIPAGTLSAPLVYSQSALYGASYNPGLNVTPGSGVASAPSFIDPNGARPPRLNQWNISIQRELTKDLVVEAAYVGNRGVWWEGPGLQNINAINPLSLVSRGLDITQSSTQTLLKSSITSPQASAAGFRAPYPGFVGTVAQALRPFPQFGSIGATWSPLGNTWYDALQLKATKRFSYGLQFQVSYAWSKNLATTEDGTGTVVPVNNVFDRPNQKTISMLDQPQLLTISYTYQIPAVGFVRKNWLTRAALADWTLGGILTYGSGLPIQSPVSNNGLSSLLFQSTFQNRVPGQALFLHNLNCGCYDPNTQLVLNPAAWTDAGAGQWGTAAAYYEDYRYQRRPLESMSLGKRFPIKERMVFSIRVEFFNIFNRVIIPNPANSNAQAVTTYNSQGLLSGGFGYINTQTITSNNQNNALPAPRTGQIVARFDF